LAYMTSSNNEISRPEALQSLGPGRPPGFWMS
jgi:hypothetical protein